MEPLKLDGAKLSAMRQQHEDAVATERRLFSEYHDMRQKAEGATTALKALIAQFGSGITLFPCFLVVALIAKELGAEELTNNSNRLEAFFREAQKEKQALHERLSSQEAWYARNEVVKFRRSRRYEKTTPTNFAKAMAGLPDYGWLHSLRRCSIIREIKESSLDSATNYKLFMLLDSIIKKMRPLKVRKVETKLRAELLREDADWILKAHFGPSWWYIEQAFAACVGKRISRKKLPYRLMAAIQDNLERPKTIPELELAKHRQLV